MHKNTRKYLPSWRQAIASVMLLLISSASPAAVTVYSGVVTLYPNTTLRDNCEDILIKSGATLVYDNATVLLQGNLRRESGSVFTQIASVVEECYPSFFIIPATNGKTVIFSL